MRKLTRLLLMLALAAPAAVAAEAPKMAREESAIFAGGCFWCMEKPFEQVAGVTSVVSGYSGGTTANPDYGNYAAGGHLEVIRVTYDPSRVSYEQLLQVFWRQIDPTDAGGQFVDRGPQYTTAIFYLNEAQRKAALASKRAMEASGRFGTPIVTPIRKAMPFYPAEEYHQDFYKKSSFRYWYYRSRSGRDDYLQRIWGDEAKH